MNKLISTIKQMSLFQKIQFLSAFVPRLSIIFVFTTTYIVCCKNKLGYLLFTLCSFSYFILFFIFSSINILPLFKYLICVLISLIGNFFMILIQRSKTQTF